jgi:hypothetical protein
MEDSFNSFEHSVLPDLKFSNSAVSRFGDVMVSVLAIRPKVRGFKSGRGDVL